MGQRQKRAQCEIIQKLGCGVPFLTPGHVLSQSIQHRNCVLVLLQKLMSWAGAQKGDVNVTVEETLSGLRKQMEY